MTKVRIGHLDFALVEMDKINSAEVYGLYVPAEQEIQLAKGMTRRRQSEVILHEILHGIVDHYNLAHVMGDKEEPIVRGLALGLANVIRDNQKLFANLVAQLK